jgi:hypothetical protein
MTDADTIRNADELWALVHRIQETIGKDGRPLCVAIDGDRYPPLALLRMLADECDPENGRY